MSSKGFSSITEQVAAYLKTGLLEGRWKKTMPGRNRLADELEVSRKTVQGALELLEKEAILVSQGPGRRRRIVLPYEGTPAPSLRIAILEYDTAALGEDYMVDLMHRLKNAGHHAFPAGMTLTGLGMKIPRVRRFVEEIETDAWVVGAGSREVLAWFAEQETPAFALFGRRKGLPIAGIGPDQVAAGRAAVRRLIAFGHRRIVLLVRESQRSAGIGASERAILDEMEAHDLPTSRYNLPDWEDSPEGLHLVLEELFRVTPPTALIIDEPFLFHAAKDHLAQKGIVAPAHISLICSDPDPTFAWCRPTIAHIRWDSAPVVRRIMRWATNVARGKNDRSQTLTKAEFVEGGTIGPAPGKE